ncbi:glycine dehydrogenase (decarboxylating) alpha subunit /glycine dehydrogenase (decarboxylating) beta subunit [Brevibacterium sanguinis]|uniref:glycine dehydrogenase (aminomethyl-transferring) n=2 Tax=Brevibacterium TaxID=1696 RepID=A0A366IH45_9MICO|nr:MULTISPECIES: aminomethyl-transferring glycine dehydrogenase [Brevibacterium]RBP62205.1 glycine dehydrogenase (decarboxylating) alpha subunit /glycine dehydrogenase (decarboxylating) beta subunit [Brevibacterium sanguinis]RBP70663.1 glycine dehydrogenase (decarboxylating) alpha subunit /glycine dehydrogenase (decarboxylating) beta subunit [Brevibacterium celere]
MTSSLAHTTRPTGDTKRPFSDRHIGPRATDIEEMLEELGYDSLEALSNAAVPESIQIDGLDFHSGHSEVAVLSELRDIAAKNTTRKQMIGQGYYDTITPAVIRRNLVENPAWYTAYTPYQPEISQGRLEALLNFQQVIQDLTGLDIANASLLDEATAVAEAVLLMRRAVKKGTTVVLDSELHPQTIAVVRARARAMDFRVAVADLSAGLIGEDIFGIVCAQPGTTGAIRTFAEAVDGAHDRGALVTFAADLLALTLLKDPASQGADIAVGSAQRFGVPLFFGGPHAGFMAVKSGLQRQLPGRIVGVSKDAQGKPAYRLALQTREQHIRRQKATSNICTAQALLANVASMYAVYHGPVGLTRIASRVHRLAQAFAAAIDTAPGAEVVTREFFDTVAIRVVNSETARLVADAAGFNIRVIDPTTIGVSFGESHTVTDANALLAALGVTARIETDDFKAAAAGTFGPNTVPEPQFDSALHRTTEFLTHPVFNSHGSETSMMRYLRTLADRDLALDRTMIPLGSCTMKLNAAAEMEAITWPEFANIHPFAPTEQTLGWRELIFRLESALAEITGYDRVSLQPNAGSQGELAGLLAIRSYHVANGEPERTVCLIPQSAHGTNAASAVLAGLQVQVVGTAEDGSVDMADLEAKIEKNGDRLAAIMITYPSTHGVFEPQVREVCDRVHAAGGQVYVDGANLNAMVGLAKPGEFGGDVSHLNLHKTFCIPHGGGGPGVGPVAVRAHLAPYLPGDATSAELVANAEDANNLPISGSMFGSAGVLPISFAYLELMGAEGLREASRVALLGANYIASKLGDIFPPLYSGQNGLVAHETILDLRDMTAKTGVTAEDVAKRLIDYGFHAPTLSFPVPGTLMVEPTESEDKSELDRFIEAMRSIHAEIEAIGTDYSYEESPLAAAPHPATVVMDDWDAKYTREQAVFPVSGLRQTKYFPPVSRIDGAYGDRNLVCSCPPPEAFEENSAADENEDD